MKKKLIYPHIDFTDSTFKSFQSNKEDHTLTIFMESWDAKKLKIIFLNVIHFTYNLGYIPKELYEIEDSLIKETIINKYGNPVSEKIKLYVMEDIEDFVMIEILAREVSVFEE